MIYLPLHKAAQIPPEWKWLQQESGPKMLIEGLKQFGTMEHPGKGSFPDFSAWTRELGISDVMTDDDIPWCGVFMGIRAKRAGWDVPEACYRAANWQFWGNHSNVPALDDVLVFVRPKGHHVATYIGENETEFAVLGGNQSNKVGIAFIAKDRLLASRRAPWKIAQPANVRRIFVNHSGVISTNEA
jgi:uncharacterized protein (TIGR02594 family)